jgi:gas vesicle protein GvpG
MGLISTILTLPLAPIRGLIGIAEIVQEEVEREYQSPVAIQREAEEIERARAAGEISAEEQARSEQELVNRLIE